ncbi:MAG: YvcK family protein [bacterium]|nr:YvcK family protein [bacterium]
MTAKTTTNTPKKKKSLPPSKASIWRPGLGIKRCFFALAAGFIFLCCGIILLFSTTWALCVEESLTNASLNWLGWHISSFSVDIFLLVLGLVCLGWGLWRAASFLYNASQAHPSSSMMDALALGRRRNYGLKIVALGGGTGLSTLLRGLKKYTSNITAVVSVSDNGGSSGRLSKELAMLPPGDIRNCLTALADDEDLLTELFRFRFDKGESQSLGGHAFGNLFIAALNQIYGDFEVALKKGSALLAIRGRVLPATLTATVLCAKMRDGRIIKGESEIPSAQGEITDVFLEPGSCQAPPEVIKAIEEADAIILGPGSLYTSVMPNLLIKNIVKALERTEAPIIYVCNVMTQNGETDGYTAADHLQAIYHHLKKPLVDYVIANASAPNKKLLEKYAKEGSKPVVLDYERLQSMGVHPVYAKLSKDEQLVRHDPDYLAEAIMDLLGEVKYRDGSEGADSMRSPN